MLLNVAANDHENHTVPQTVRPTEPDGEAETEDSTIARHSQVLFCVPALRPILRSQTIAGVMNEPLMHPTASSTFRRLLSGWLWLWFLNLEMWHARKCTCEDPGMPLNGCIASTMHHCLHTATAFPRLVLYAPHYDKKRAATDHGRPADRLVDRSIVFIFPVTFRPSAGRHVPSGGACLGAT